MCLSLVNLYLHGFTEPHVYEYDTLTFLDRWNEYFDVILDKALVVSTRATIGRIVINRVPIATNQGFKNIVIQDSARVLPEYVALTLTKLVPQMQAWATGGGLSLKFRSPSFANSKSPSHRLRCSRRSWRR